MDTRTEAFLQGQHQHFIAGQWYAEPAQGSFVVENPATEQSLAQVARGGKTEVDLAVAAARQALEGGWRETPPARRAAILQRFADKVLQNADLLADVETLESGTPRTWSGATMSNLYPSILSYYAGWPTKLGGDTLPARPFGREDQRFLVYTEKEPIGVVGAITPWNSPTGILLMKIAPALAAGCTIVVKSPELAPLTTALLVALAAEAGLPPGVLNLVHGFGVDAGAALAVHPEVDKISFTGSTATGRQILEAAKSNLKKVSLELGGKSPFVVLPDADLDLAVPAAAVACFSMSGQNCMAATRIFVHVDVMAGFLARLDDVLAGLKVGNGFEPGVTIGPLISARQKQRVLDFISAGRADGARLYCGGGALKGPGHWVQPTVFVDCHKDMRIVREEIFGPVMSILAFDDDRQSLYSALNATTYALSGSVWSRDLPDALEVARRIDAGQVAINAHAAISPETPFGGNRQSGWGRELGREGLEEYLKTKAMSIRLS